MIHFYCGPTPDARKVAIALEELGLSYELHPIDILAGQQFTPAYFAINPTNKIPAIVDADGPAGWPITVWESGAILLYLAEKKRWLIPDNTRGRIECFKWLMFQMAEFGPIARRFSIADARQEILRGIELDREELDRQISAMNSHLERHDYFAGRHFSIADIAVYPWWEVLRAEIDFDAPALSRWSDRVAARPAVRRGMAALGAGWPLAGNRAA